MKTREEFKAAINEMMFEAQKAGFTLCIGFDAEGMAIIAAQGNRLTLLGLTVAMREQFFADFATRK